MLRLSVSVCVEKQPKAVEKLEKSRSGLTSWVVACLLKIRSTVLSPHITAGCWCDNAHNEAGTATSFISSLEDTCRLLLMTS